MSQAAQDFPGWDYPQQSLGHIGLWPHEALPAGGDWEIFFHVLKIINHPRPPSDGDCDTSFAAKVFNTIYDQTGGVIVQRALGSHVNSTGNPPIHQPVVVLGFMGKATTHAQKETIAKLMGFAVSDIIKVYIYPTC